MEKDTAKVTWTNDALSVLRHRDRHSQAGMVRDFKRIAVLEGKMFLFTQSILINVNENLYATPVWQGTYVFFWKWHEAENRIEIWAVYEKMLNSIVRVKKLIEDEGWDSDG